MNTAFHIPEPCHESWQQMYPEQNGRFCDSCCKVVVDFTGMSNDEILNYLSQRKGERVCGRVKNEQLANTGTKKTSAVLPQKKFRLQRFAAALWLVFGTFLFSACGNDNMKVGEIEALDTTYLRKADTVHANKTTGSIKQKAKTAKGVSETIGEEVPVLIYPETPVHEPTMGIMVMVPDLPEEPLIDSTGR
jgi:hypothetical protein